MSIQFPNLGITLDYVGKSVYIFGFEITFFGLAIAIGMLLGLGFVILEARRCGENKDSYLEMLIVSLITGIIGARLFYVLFSWSTYKGNIVQILNIRNGGLAFYGGLLGGVIGAALYCMIRRRPFMQMADTVSMGVVIAQIIGRWGDFFNRESFGEYTNSIFAMQLPLSAVRSGEVTTAMRENLETLGGVSYIQVHPVFLYESAWCLLLFLLMMVWKRKKRYHGDVFLRYLAGYSLGRFCFEYLRTDKLMIPGTPVGISQLISAALFLICSVVVIVRTSMAKKRAALRKRRREQDYEAQERAAREAEAEEYRDRLRLERTFSKGAGYPENETIPDARGNVWDKEALFGENKRASEENSPTDKDTAFSEESSISENSDPEAGSSPEEMEEFFKTEGKENEENTEESLFTGEEAGTSVLHPQISKEDEWLYSQPRRFAKKPADEPKN